MPGECRWNCVAEVVPLPGDGHGLRLTWKSQPCPISFGPSPLYRPAERSFHVDDSSNSSFASSVGDSDVFMPSPSPTDISPSPRFNTTSTPVGSGGFFGRGGVSRAAAASASRYHTHSHTRTPQHHGVDRRRSESASAEPKKRGTVWTVDEDRVLYETHRRIVAEAAENGEAGKPSRGKWAQVAALFPDKSESAVKNRWFRRFAQSDVPPHTPAQGDTRMDVDVDVKAEPRGGSELRLRQGRRPLAVSNTGGGTPLHTSKRRASASSSECSDRERRLSETPPSRTSMLSPDGTVVPPFMRWSPRQDARLRALVGEYEGKQWKTIAHLVGAVGPRESVPNSVQALHRWKKVRSRLLWIITKMPACFIPSLIVTLTAAHNCLTDQTG